MAEKQRTGAIVPETVVEAAPQTGAQAPASGDGAAAPVSVAALEQRVLVLEQENKSLKGRLTTRVPDEELRGIRAAQEAHAVEIRRLRRAIVEQNPDMDQTERQTELSRLSGEEQQERERGLLIAFESRQRNRINTNVAKAGLNFAHPKLQALNKQWGAATTREEFHDISDSIDDFLEAERAAQLVAKDREVEEAKQRLKQDGGAMDVAVRGGTPGANASYEAVRDAFIADSSNPAIVKRYMEMRREKGL